MKFEIVERPGEDPCPGDHVDDVAVTAPVESADPLEALKTGTARLTSGVQAEALQINACVAELTELAAQAAVARLREHDRVVARPPAGFRPDRFGASRDRGPTKEAS